MFCCCGQLRQLLLCLLVLCLLFGQGVLTAADELSCLPLLLLRCLQPGDQPSRPLQLGMPASPLGCQSGEGPVCCQPVAGLLQLLLLLFQGLPVACQLGGGLVVAALGLVVRLLCCLQGGGLGLDPGIQTVALGEVGLGLLPGLFGGFQLLVAGV